VEAGVKKTYRKEGLLFVNKKKQKNFDNLDHAGLTGTGPINKSFLVLFFKKERLACFGDEGESVGYWCRMTDAGCLCPGAELN